MKDTSSESIADALKLLEDAARQKKDELMSVMSDKYTNLRGLIVESEVSLMKSLTNAKDQMVKSATHTRDAGVEKAYGITRDVGKNVHANPWPYLAGTAVFGLLLGVILGRNPK